MSYQFSLDELNPQQKSACLQTRGPVLILAGAGSGKTKTLTFRMAHLIKNLGVSAGQILGITFTNKAAEEMTERARKLIGPKAKRLQLSTFHALGLKLLKEFGEHIGLEKRFGLYDTADQLAIIKEGLRNYRAEKKFDAYQILGRIGQLKNNGIEAEEFASSKFFDPESPYNLATEYIYSYYQEKLRFFHAIDFDDILLLTVKLLEKNQEVALQVSDRYQYIMIDEYQDTNSLQLRLVFALTKNHNNICVVGDDDQSIYSFRGADINNILDFERHFDNVKIIKLEQNYRSTMPILGLANEVIKGNKKRMDKSLWSSTKSDVMPLLWSTADQDHEAQVVVEDIVQYQKKGLPLSEVAILYRSNNQSQILEEELRASMVPYRMVGGQKFYEKKEVKDFMAYLALILNPNNQLALRRAINTPNRGIGNTTLNKLLELSKNHKISLYKTIERFAPTFNQRADHLYRFIQLIGKYRRKEYLKEKVSSWACELLEEIQFFDFIRSHYDNPSQAQRRIADVEQFIMSAQRFENYHQEKADLKSFLDRIMLQDSQDQKDQNESEEDQDVKANEITLMTLHSSKGLEFDQVYIVGMEENFLPHKKVVKEDGDIDEERRLCYVGITRARKKLIMSYCKKRELYGKKNPSFKSRFIKELEEQETEFFQEQDRTTFGHFQTEEEVTQYKKSFFQDLMSKLESPPT